MMIDFSKLQQPQTTTPGVDTSIPAGTFRGYSTPAGTLPPGVPPINRQRIPSPELPPNTLLPGTPPPGTPPPGGTQPPQYDPAYSPEQPTGYNPYTPGPTTFPGQPPGQPSFNIPERPILGPGGTQPNLPIPAPSWQTPRYGGPIEGAGGQYLPSPQNLPGVTPPPSPQGEGGYQTTAQGRSPGGSGGTGGGGTSAGNQTTTQGADSTWRPGGGTGDVDWSHSIKWPGAGSNVQQNWKRDPSWGGHVIWNPYWGFQDFPTIAQMYDEAGGPVTRNQMLGWDLTQQPGPDWSQYFPDRQVGGGGGGAGGGSWDWGDFFNQPPAGGDGQGWTEGGTMQEPGAFPYPEQWGTASDVFTRFAEGLPTDTGSWWEAQQAPFERRISDQVKQMAEQMGLGGLRYSTPITHQIADITGRESANMWSQLADRQLSLTEAAKNRGMQAAGGLTGLGQQYLNAPQDWAQRMYGMGQGMTGMGQQGLDRAYQDWGRMTPEQNPWFGQAMGFAGMQNQMTPQQYQQSPFSQFLSALMGGAGMYAGLR